MRDLKAEKKVIDRLFQVAGFGYLLGLLALAVGTEMFVLTYYDSDPIKFWIFQGLWAMVLAILIASIAKSLKTVDK